LLPTIAVTVDIHPWDRPESLRACDKYLRERNIPATFLISTSMLENPIAITSLRELSEGIHELGTHAHTHKGDEIAALEGTTSGSLKFLERSKHCFEDFYGFSPASFRSPTWCGLGQPALQELVRLGYKVDCSATPQRPGVLGNFPMASPWLLTSRSPYWIWDGLLEIPTSSLLVPLASPSFATLRKLGSKVFLRLLLAEANFFKDRILVIDFDSRDFEPERPEPEQTFEWQHLLPRREGGFEWRKWLRTYNPRQVFAITRDLIDTLSGYRFSTLSDIRASICREAQ
jgi:hypothetical protein